MKYLKGFFFNFLTVFFANYILPGIQTISYTKFPHLGGDMIFAIALGALNSLIVPVLKIFGKGREVPLSSIAIVAMVVNFLSYALLKFFSFGVEVRTVEGYLLASLVVTIASFAINYFEVKSHVVHHEPPNSL